MLMFDNFLFASLIPQILMVLGFFSCLIAPLFSNADALQTAAPDDKQIFIQQKNQTETQVERIAHFSDFQKDEVDLPNILKIPHFYASSIQHPLLQFPLMEFDVAFSHISRPPPSLSR